MFSLQSLGLRQCYPLAPSTDLDNVDSHIELPAISNGIPVEEFHDPRIDRLVYEVEDVPANYR
jgi:hypothetical protein